VGKKTSLPCVSSSLRPSIVHTQSAPTPSSTTVGASGTSPAPHTLCDALPSARFKCLGLDLPPARPPRLYLEQPRNRLLGARAFVFGRANLKPVAAGPDNDADGDQDDALAAVLSPLWVPALVGHIMDLEAGAAASVVPATKYLGWAVAEVGSDSGAGSGEGAYG
jgi:hypothetical protein